MMKTCKPSGGFAYIALLATVAIIGILSAGSLQIGTLIERRSAEEDLLYIGIQFQQALASYASATPPGTSPMPTSVEDLLRDHRYPGVRRHLRKFYVDPITGKADWVILNATGLSGIVGFHSASDMKPIKAAGFPKEFQNLINARAYSDWVFVGPLWNH